MDEATRNIRIEICAISAHECNRMYCWANGDSSHKDWNSSPEELKTSVRNGVIRVLEGKFPTELHQAWVDEKLANGWKYGPVKDFDKKEHPCLVKYAELPEHDRKKDTLFFRIVTDMAQMLDLFPKFPPSSG